MSQERCARKRKTKRQVAGKGRHIVNTNNTPLASQSSTLHPEKTNIDKTSIVICTELHDAASGLLMLSAPQLGLQILLPSQRTPPLSGLFHRKDLQEI